MSPAAPPAASDADPATGRRWHYADFYGLRPAPEDDRPLVLVWGNCQAESLRLLLEGTPDRPYRTLRVPPVHELEAADLPHLTRVLERTDVLVSQPVAAGYRGLPLGTSDLLSGRSRRLVLFPVIRHGALYPWHAIVRSPGAGDPPIAPYHDLRTLLLAAGADAPADPPAPETVRAVADHALGQLRDREQRHGTVVVSDLLLAAGTGAAHTLNHPGNPVLIATARRIQEAAGWPALARDPGRVLLASVMAPLEPAVLAALSLTGEPREGWLVEGTPHGEDEVRDAHLAWYREHPAVVAAGLTRHAEQLRLLGGR